MEAFFVQRKVTRALKKEKKETKGKKKRRNFWSGKGYSGSLRRTWKDNWVGHKFIASED